MSKNPLAIAEKIFSNGIIEDPEDWEEMKIALEFELDELGILDETTREEILSTVKDRWY